MGSSSIFYNFISLIIISSIIFSSYFSVKFFIELTWSLEYSKKPLVFKILMILCSVIISGIILPTFVLGFISFFWNFTEDTDKLSFIYAKVTTWTDIYDLLYIQTTIISFIPIIEKVLELKRQKRKIRNFISAASSILHTYHFTHGESLPTQRINNDLYSLFSYLRKAAECICVYDDISLEESIRRLYHFREFESLCRKLNHEYTINIEEEIINNKH